MREITEGLESFRLHPLHILTKLNKTKKRRTAKR
jgi:hypothetical protein